MIKATPAGLPQPVTCTLVHRTVDGQGLPDSYQAASCEEPCEANSVDDACRESMAVLGAVPQEIPFSCLVWVDERGCRMGGSSGGFARITLASEPHRVRFEEVVRRVVASANPEV